MSGQNLQLKLEALVNKIAAVRVIANVELAQEQLTSVLSPVLQERLSPLYIASIWRYT